MLKKVANASTVRGASRQASSTAFSSEPVEESACTEFLQTIQTCFARPELIENSEMIFFSNLPSATKPHASEGYAARRENYAGER
jgi:hypothetical protein